MKLLLPVFVLAVIALSGTSCTTPDQTNTNYSRPYRKASAGGYYASPRMDPFGAPGLWDVRQGGGGTSIGYQN